MIASVCKLKSDSFYWVVWDDYRKLCDSQCNADGRAESRAAAVQAIAAQYGNVSIWGDAIARRYRSYMHKLKAQARPAAETTYVGRIEYLYGYWRDVDGQCGDSITTYRITRMTKKFIFFEGRSCGNWTPELGVTLYPHPPVDPYIRRLDRALMEAEGSQWIRGSDTRFYLDPHALYDQVAEERTPLCAKALGLQPNFTADQAKAAFRTLAKQLHPDAGGDAQQFIALQRNYEKALTLAKES